MRRVMGASLFWAEEVVRYLFVWSGFLRVFLDSFWALLSPVIILGTIYGGICTPTEAAVISVVYALLRN